MRTKPCGRCARSQATNTFRRITQCGRNASCFVCVLDAREHHACGTEIQYPAGALPRARLHPHQRCGNRPEQCSNLPDRLTFGTRAVLEIDERPVETRTANAFCRQRRAERKPAAERRIAFEDTLPERGFH